MLMHLCEVLDWLIRAWCSGRLHGPYTGGNQVRSFVTHFSVYLNAVEKFLCCCHTLHCFLLGGRSLSVWTLSCWRIWTSRPQQTSWTLSLPAWRKLGSPCSSCKKRALITLITGLNNHNFSTLRTKKLLGGKKVRVWCIFIYVTSIKCASV